MKRLLDKGFLLAAVTVYIFWQPEEIWIVAALFLCIGIVCLYSYIQKRRVLQVLYGAAAAAALFVAPAGVFLPVLAYDLVYEKEWLLLTVSALLSVRSFGRYGFLGVVIWGLLFAAAALLAFTARRYDRLALEHKKQRDTSRELELLLKNRNKDLMEKQDYEVHLATLHERNRIAREIHDNVGHLLSRSILQMGAVKALSRQQNLTEPLRSVSDTLNQAMDSIRSSVHNLYEASLELEASIANILKDYEMYQIDFKYDISSELPKELNYCFLTVIKEALVNVVKHSNGTEIQITLREFSGQYQLIFRDNGSLHDEKTHSGIGLENMRERVSAFRGTIYIRHENGFQIFISIPVERSKQQ